MEIEVAQTASDGGSSVGQLMQREKRKKRRVVPLREDQIKQITKVDESTGKEKVVEEISLLDSDDEGELNAREAEEEKEENRIELHDLIQKDAGRKYYKRFTLDGCDYGLGDTVVLRSDDERGNFVGIIESIFCLKTILPIKKEGAKHQLSKPHKKTKYKIKVRWFFQKFDIDDRLGRDLKIPRKGFPGVATMKEEVYWSFAQDINGVSSVLCPARIIYCPAATDPQQMAAICQNEPNTYFCRYIYDSTRFYHINNYAEDWDTEDERCFEVQALYLRLLQQGVEFPSHSESEPEDSDFDADADSCTPEPLEGSVTTVLPRKPSLGTMFVEVKRETLPAQKGASSGSDANSDDRRESMNGETYILDSDTPLDDEEENEEEAVMEQEEQEEEEMKDGDDDENLATNRRKRRAEKGKEKATDNGKRRKSSDAVMLTDDYVHLETIVRSPPERAASGSPSLPTSSSSSLEAKQKLVKAAKADRKRRKSIEKQALEETEERREVNRRRQQQLDDEMKKLSLQPRKKSAGKSVLIETPDFLPLDTDTTTLPPRCRRRRASQGDAGARGEEISFRKKATAGTTTPASAAASDDDNAPLDLSDREVDLPADTGTYDKTSESSGASASASTNSAWASTWDNSTPTVDAPLSSSAGGSGWADAWDAVPSTQPASSTPTTDGSLSSSAGGGGWADAWDAVPSTQPASSAGGESTGQTGWSATYATEDSSSSLSTNHEAYADEGRSRGYGGGGGGGGVCYKCNKPGHMARECTESVSGPLPEVGSTCPAKVMSVGKKDGRAFGIFVRPEGCCQDGLVHFTRMLRRRVEPDDEDLLQLVGGVGATVNVKVLDIEEENGKRRLKLSMKDADQQPPNVDASGGGGDKCFKCGVSGHLARDCPGVSGQGFGGSASGGHSSGTANSAWESAGSIDQHVSSNSEGGGTGLSFMHPDRARALGLGLSPASTPLSSSVPSAPPASNFPGAVGGGYALPAHDQQPQQLHQFQQPPQYQPQHITFVMPPAYPQPAPQTHGYQPPQGHNTGWAGRNSSTAPPPPQPQLQPQPYASASSASAAPSSLLSPTLTEEEEAELATVPYDLTTLNQARLGQLTMMQWFRRNRRRFNVEYLKGLLVRVLLNGQGYVGEIVGVVRSEPYYLTSYFEPTSPPEDPAQLAQALNDHTLIRVTFKLMVEIPGVDEGRAYPADAISSNYFSHQEMVHWLLGRKAMRLNPLTLEEIEDKKRIIAKARAKSDLPPSAANLHRRHRKSSLGLSSASSPSPSSASPSLGQAVSRSDKGKEKVQGEELEVENGGAAMPMIISSSDVEPEPLSLTMPSSATSR